MVVGAIPTDTVRQVATQDAWACKSCLFLVYLKYLFELQVIAREIYFRIPIFLCGNTPATIG